MTQIRINAVAYQEGDAWIIQGIEYDIVASAKDVASLFPEFMQKLWDTARVSKHLGRSPFEGIQQAPARFQEMFQSALNELRPVQPLPDASATVTVRLAA